MATFTRCYTPIKGRVLRVALLDTCGIPVSGADSDSSMVVFSGFTQVAQSAQYETGEEYFVTTADDAVCVNEKARDNLKRLTLTIDSCQVDPGLPATMGLVRLLTASESPTGTGFALPEGSTDKHVSMELWQRATGDAACGAGGLAQWVYNAWPHLVSPRIGDYNISSSPSSLQIIADSKAVNAAWTLGEPWLGVGAVTVEPDHWFQNLTTTEPPDPVCGIQDLL